MISTRSEEALVGSARRQRTIALACAGLAGAVGGVCLVLALVV